MRDWFKFRSLIKTKRVELDLILPNREIFKAENKNPAQPAQHRPPGNINDRIIFLEERNDENCGHV